MLAKCTLALCVVIALAQAYPGVVRQTPQSDKLVIGENETMTMQVINGTLVVKRHAAIEEHVHSSEATTQADLVLTTPTPKLPAPVTEFTPEPVPTVEIDVVDPLVVRETKEMVSEVLNVATVAKTETKESRAAALVREVLEKEAALLSNVESKVGELNVVGEADVAVQVDHDGVLVKRNTNITTVVEPTVNEATNETDAAPVKRNAVTEAAPAEENVEPTTIIVNEEDVVLTIADSTLETATYVKREIVVEAFNLCQLEDGSVRINGFHRFESSCTKFFECKDGAQMLEVMECSSGQMFAQGSIMTKASIDYQPGACVVQTKGMKCQEN